MVYILGGEGAARQACRSRSKPEYGGGDDETNGKRMCLFSVRTVVDSGHTYGRLLFQDNTFVGSTQSEQWASADGGDVC